MAADYGPDHPIHNMAIKVDKDMAGRITEFVMDNVFIMQDAENDSCERKKKKKYFEKIENKMPKFKVRNLEEPDRIQLMAKRRNLLTQYSKLFLYGLLPIIEIGGVLKHFTKVREMLNFILMIFLEQILKFYSDFGDIMKNLLQKCREMDKWATAKAIVNALICSYEELKVILFYPIPIKR